MYIYIYLYLCIYSNIIAKLLKMKLKIFESKNYKIE